MVQAKVTLTQPQNEGRQFVARTGRGHNFLIDDKDGGTGPTPIELVAAALAGCTAFDVISMLRKKREQVIAYEVLIEADQAPEPPTVFTEVRIRHVITGRGVSPKAVQDAIQLSEEKYCSVGAMIAKTAKIVATFEIHEPTASTTA